MDPDYEKTDEDLEDICKAMGEYIFGNELDVSTMHKVAKSMAFFRLPEDTDVCIEGDLGSYYYVTLFFFRADASRIS